MPNVILYYVVSPVHLHNVSLLAPSLAGGEVRVAYEKASPWLTGDSSKEFEMVGFGRGDLPDGLWEGEVLVVVFSAVQPRRGPLDLLEAALQKGIPTVAIEESNQMALNQGGINNYVLPVDHVLTASKYEQQSVNAQTKAHHYPLRYRRIYGASGQGRVSLARASEFYVAQPQTMSVTVSADVMTSGSLVG